MHRFAEINLYCYTAMIILLLFISKGLWLKFPCSNFSFFCIGQDDNSETVFLFDHNTWTSPTNQTTEAYKKDFWWILYILQMGASAVWLIFKRLLSTFQSLISVLRISLDMSCTYSRHLQTLVVSMPFSDRTKCGINFLYI